MKIGYAYLYRDSTHLTSMFPRVLVNTKDTVLRTKTSKGVLKFPQWNQNMKLKVNDVTQEVVFVV